MAYKAEELAKGSNLRFVVTSQTDLTPLTLYNWYGRRGEPELWIKDLKDACFADRLSCHRFWANQFRLLLHAAAYWLLDTLRRELMQAGVARLQLDTLRIRLVKIGGWVRRTRRRPTSISRAVTPASRSGASSPLALPSVNNPG